MESFDYLIAGAGLAGLVLAERLATQHSARCLIVDLRDHIGGNCYDEYDAHGVLIHKYGPHYFRTNSSRIRDYLGQFTEWHPVDYRVLSYAEGRYWSFPINLKTYEQMVGRSATETEFAEYLTANRVPIENPKNSEEVIVSQVGWELYRRFFEGYTLKQWKRHPRDLDASVCGRIPVRTNADDRYFNDQFQALPKKGYTEMFKRMLQACGERAELRLGTDYRAVVNSIKWGHMIYTGPIDEFYGFKFGPLPYRSLRFEPEHFTGEQLASQGSASGQPGFWQPALQVNYPNEREYTRIVEVKHATGQECDGTTIVREYPADFGPGMERYYPIPAPDTNVIYRKYAQLAEAEKNVSFVGRLATYKYYNMDQVVGMALHTFEALAGSRPGC
jgi:UDP-galactopyranose mutase